MAPSGIEPATFRLVAQCLNPLCFVFSCTLYFIRTWFLVLIVLDFTFYLYLQHTTQKSMPPVDFFLSVLCVWFVVLIILALTFVLYCTTHTTQTSMPPAGFKPSIPARVCYRSLAGTEGLGLYHGNERLSLVSVVCWQVERSICDKPIPHPQESYRLWRVTV